MTIDPETATIDDLDAALCDCYNCCAAEYPETEEGYGRACARSDVLDDALRRRFGDRGAAVIRDAHSQADRTSRIYHGRG